MGMIATYDFYKSKYYGEIIPESDFPKFESYAEDNLHQLTFQRLYEAKEYDIKVQKAVCALADLEYRMEQSRKQAGLNENGTGKAVKTKTSGNESISYEIIPDAVSAALTDMKAQEKMKYDTASRYLQGTGLLYAGM